MGAIKATKVELLQFIGELYVESRKSTGLCIALSQKIDMLNEQLKKRENNTNATTDSASDAGTGKAP